MTIPVLDTNNISDTWLTLVQRVNTMIGRFNDLNTFDDIAITGGSISGASINTPSLSATSATITSSLTLSGATITLDNDAISGDKISGGTIDNVMIELSGSPSNTNHATSKQYVDGLISTVSSSISSLSSSIFSFKTISVPTQTSVVAIAIDSTLNLNAGSGISITTNNTTKTITFSISTITESMISGSPIPINKGGTGETTAANAATALGVGSASLARFGSVGVGVAAPLAGNLKVQKTASFDTETNNGTVVGNFSIDWREGQKQRVTLGATGLNMSFTAPNGVGHFQLKIIQDGSGNRLKGTWPTIKTSGGSANDWVLSTNPNAVDILTLYYDGSEWWGQLSLDWS